MLWWVALGRGGSLDMLLTYFIDHLNCVDGGSIDGYTLGQHRHRFVLLVLTATNTRFPSFCSCVWWVALGRGGSVDMLLTYFIDHLNCFDGVNIDGYSVMLYPMSNYFLRHLWSAAGVFPGMI